jgi:hypothetical protein
VNSFFIEESLSKPIREITEMAAFTRRSDG